MVPRVATCALAGLEGTLVHVEVDIHPGLPHTTIVGLPDAAVRESKDRLLSGIRNAGFRYPTARITVNLAPADVRKEGPAYDLPMALAILIADGQIDVDLADALVIGEISLDGALRHTNGILPVAAAARDLGLRRIVLSSRNAAEAALVPGLDVVASDDIRHLIAVLDGTCAPAPVPAVSWDDTESDTGGADLADVRGQGLARRAIEIAAAGGHNLLMTGPPGAGKTMLARCLPSILPPLAPDEALEVTAVYSVAGALPHGRPLVRRRPFRSPHHSISNAGLVGGGTWPRPGEASLAHHGVLFMDELPEFDPHVLESLRQPIEDRIVTIARAAGRATFPASFTLVAARNPCPCGHYSDDGHDCSCQPSAVARYRRRVSGPLLDRIDMHVDVPKVQPARILEQAGGEPSAAVRARVVDARGRQRQRLGEALGVPEDARRQHPRAWELRLPTCNAEVSTRALPRLCQTTPEAESVLRAGLLRLDLSARAVHRVVRLARTIADLDCRDRIEARHVAEALQFRSRETN